jgi:N-sulfoglucosamine sulfohydrolase
VLFTSEQGSQFPGCKWTNWDTGVHTALIARWPGKVSAGKRTDELVQYCDVLPTIMDLAGAETTGHNFDGVSFRSVLEGSAGQRKFAYFMHNNLPEGPPYPVRSITDGSYRYIQNLTPNELYIEKHLMGTRGKGDLNNPYWGTWTWDSQQNPATYNLVKRYMLRPPEQLYHTAEDGYEMNNLVSDSTFSERKQQLKTELTNWMTRQGDPGILQDTMDALEAARKQQHLFFPK